MAAPGTHDHKQPRREATSASAPVLLAAFPISTVLPLSGATDVIGREWLAARGVRDDEVSGQHARVAFDRGRASIQDAGSRNGTWLDGQRLVAGETMALTDGAIVRLGRSLLVFREAFEDPLTPCRPLGELVGPFGLRSVARTLEAFTAHPPRTVLVVGESGAGKELLASAVATALGRAHRYVAVNVAGVAAGVFESQLFGHVAGAFSDARRASDGVIAAHEGGAVFLDEIGELPLELQPKLLRLLENREVLPVGAERPRHVDVLLVAATNRDLEQMVELGQFRQDLYARLALAELRLPPLRERAEDIFAIASVLAPRVGLRLAADDPEVEVEAVERLLLDPWPTNARGLMAALGKVAALDRTGGLHVWAIDRVLGPRPSSRPGQLSQAAIEEALAAAGGNESEGARRLGISRGRLRRLLGKG